MDIQDDITPTQKMTERLIKLAIITIISLTSTLQAQTTYYVDATGGNDANNGTSEATAWQTISKVNNQTFTSGDVVLFKRDEIWRGRLIPQGSGNATNWITYSAYGTGENPQIFGSEQVTGWILHSGNIYKKTNLNLPAYAGDGLWEFDDYNADPIILQEDTSIPSEAGHWFYDENENNGTVYLICSDASAPSTHNIEMSMFIDVIDIEYLSYIEISDFSLKFGNCKNLVVYKSDHINISDINSSFQGYYGNPNIFSVGSNHVKIENCVLYESDNSGIAFYPAGTLPGHHNIVRGCIISRMRSNDGITIHEDSSNNLPGDYHLLENNIISECPEGSIDATSNYHIFRNNICFDNGEDSFQIGGNHILVENNVCYGNSRHGIISFSNVDGGNIIRNNIIYDNVKYGLMTNDKPVSVYNNTICNSDIRSEVYFGYNAAPFTATFKNNIVYDDIENSSVYFGNGLPTDVEMEYNNYNIEENDDLIFGISDTGQHHTLEEIQNVYNTELNSFVANPLFEDAPNKNFHIDENSPCIDTGGFLTTTLSSGTGAVIQLEDVSYFCDGFGLIDGDVIQLEGQTQQLNITSIDTVNNTISVDQNFSWNAGDGVALVYNGAAPDIGAYEFQNSSGVNEVSISNAEIYPNPTTDILIVTSKTSIAQIAVYNNLSQLVLRNSNKNSIDVSSLNQGLYYIKMENIDGGFIVKKIIKK